MTGRRFRLLDLAAIVVIATGAGYLLLRGGTADDSPDLAAAPGPAARPAVPASGPDARADTDAPGSAAGAAPPTDYQQRFRNRFAALDAAFAAEPVAAAWSNRTTAMIESLIADGLPTGATPPRESDIDCRSNGCRISMAFDDPMQAEDFSTELQLALGSDFVRATAIPLAEPDGRVVLHLFAVLESGRHLLREAGPRPPPGPSATDRR